jgi:hypothetical protein
MYLAIAQPNGSDLFHPTLAREIESSGWHTVSNFHEYEASKKA